jgi:hypothetical protein
VFDPLAVRRELVVELIDSEAVLRQPHVTTGLRRPRKEQSRRECKQSKQPCHKQMLQGASMSHRNLQRSASAELTKSLATM